MKKIPFTNCDQFALVDDADYPFLSKFKWRLMKDRWNSYAWRNGKKGVKQGFMHKIIMQPPDGLMVDHINHDGLDNRRENLRICTNAQNQANARGWKNNTSGYRGVVYCRSRNRPSKWRAEIRREGRTITLGYFRTAEEAAETYKVKAREMWGEFSPV